MNKTLILLCTLLLLLLGGNRLSAQVLAKCPSLGGFQGPGALFCSQSCIYCTLDGHEDMNDQTLPPGGGVNDPNSICKGDIILENPRWYGFISGSAGLVLEIIPISCSGTDGLQAAILDGCSNNIVCAPGTAGGAGQSLTLISLTGIFPGKPYQLVVDGFNGDVCRYRIRVVAGSVYPLPLGAVGSISGPTQVCPKAEVEYSIPPVENAVTYTWVAPAGSRIDGTNSNVRVKSGGDLAAGISVKFGPVGGSVCVTVSNICDAPTTTCLAVTNTALPPHILPERTLCYEELPFEWEESPNTSIVFPGTYNLSSSAYTSYLGCDSIVKQKIIVKPRKTKTLPLTWLCEGDCLNIGGSPYCDAGTYQEILTADDGCDSTVYFTIVRIANKAVVQPKPDTLTCARTSVKLTSTGSTPRSNIVTYNWINSSGQSVSTADTAVVSAPGTYSLIVTSVGGGKYCRDTASVVVIGSTAVPNANAGPPRQLTCSIGQVQLQGSGSTGPNFSYLWTASNGGNIQSGSTTLTPIVDKVGTYTLKVTNGTNGCTATSFVNVTADLTPPTLSVQSGEFNCEITFFTLNATTNAANPTYNWSGPNGFSSTQPSPLTNLEGTYYLTITDTGLNGCTATASATVTANTAPPGASATAGVLTCVVDSVILHGSSSAPASSYTWTGPNGFTSNLQNPTVGAIGVYTLKVTAANFCTSTATTTVSRNDTQPGASLSVSGNLHCNAATVNLVVTSTANPNNLNHVWTLPDSSTVMTGKLPILTVNQAGTYIVMVTDSINGCSSRDTIAVSRNANVTATATLGQNVSCFGGNNGTATAAGGGGNGNFAYTWSTGANTATATGLVAGTYTVTVNDGNNCTATAVVTIIQPDLLTPHASATAQSANLVADGTATAAPTGGTSPYTYAWNTGGNTATITGLLPGVYTVTVSDAQGCTAVQAVTVNAYNCSIQSSVNAVNVSCNGTANGSASVSLTGGVSPFTYAWSTGASTPDVSGLAPGQYTVVVTDAANCPSEASFIITQPNVLNANVSSSDASGPTAADGSVSSGPTGGTSGYSYLWSTGAGTASVGGLLPGIYTVTVTDANGCTAVDEVEVSFIDCTIAANVATLNPLCHGQSNGSVTVSLAGGTAPFGYLWNTGAVTPGLSGVAAGTYTLTATDANGCTLTVEATLDDPALLTAAIDSTQSPECTNALNGSISASAAGGTGMLSYAWSNGRITPIISGLGIGTYTLTVSDANGCTTTQQATLQAEDHQAPSISQSSPATLSIGLSGTVTATQQNLNLQVTDNCTVASVTFQPSSFNCDQVGTKTVTVTAIDLAGNTSTASFDVQIVDNLAPILACPDNIVRCTGDNVVNYQAPTVSDNCIFGGSFQQTAGLASGATFPEGITLNTYTYTDKAGNVGSCSFEVNILAPIAVTVVQVINDVNNMNSGSINISVSGGLIPYGFQWQQDGVDIPGAIGEDLNNIGAGIYTVKITDSNGCTFSGPPIVVLPSGTEEPAWASGFSIRPNPTSGHAEAIFPQVTVADIHLFAYDQTGRQVLSLHRPPQQRLDLDFQALASGTYTILLRVGSEQVVRKVVVSK